VTQLLRKKRNNVPVFIACIVCGLLWFPLSAPGYDLSKDKVAYVVSTSHLDDQWQWTYDSTISTFIPRTLRGNFALIRKYPDYIFSWEGAYRYWLVKKFYPKEYDTLKQYVAKGNWVVAGSMAEPCDAHIPSPESLIRQILYGNNYFMDEFGKKSVDVFMPDCFGFGYALPTVAAHCGLKGFSTCRVEWHSFWTWPFPPPFPIGRWKGVDGSTVVGVFKIGPWYVNAKVTIHAADGDTLQKTTGIWATWSFVGVGDRGGALPDSTVATLMKLQSDTATSAIKVVNTSSDQIFRDLTASQMSALKEYDGEITNVLETGCLTSHADIKLLNRKNEQRAVAAEHAAIMANYCTGAPYPTDKIWLAWWRVLAHQFHDDLPGTSLLGAYTKFTIPDEDTSYNDFTQVVTDASNAVASKLDTRVQETDRVPLVLFNQLSVDRRDLVEATVSFANGAVPAGVKVFDPAGREVPAQLTGSAGQNATIAFVASVPSAGYAVYEVKPVTTPNPASPSLRISIDTLENDFYKVAVNANGDIAGILDKKLNKQLLSAPSRFEGQTDSGSSYVIPYFVVQSGPVWFVDGTVQKSIVENGPARVSLKISRTKAGSVFTQYIRLAADSAGARVDVDNTVDWKSPGILLSVSFPMTATNSSATYDLGLGTITRPNSTDTKHYEYSAQQWADITNSDGTYGMSVLTDCKYGWHKKANNLLHLSLIHGQIAARYNGDQFVHSFTYSFYSHSGNWTNGTVVQGAQLNQPVIAFQTTPHTGAFGKVFSFLRTATPQVFVMAVKKAEKSNGYIIRVRETQGKAVQGATVTFGSSITSASEILGSEDPKPNGSVQVSGNDLVFNMTPYQPKTFSVILSPPTGIRQNIPTSMRHQPAQRVITVCSSLARQLKIRIPVPEQETILGVSIIDSRGRLVKTLYEGNGSSPKLSGSSAFTWDGKGGKTQRARPGVYFVNVKTGGGHVSARLLVF
jgi:alpha-mannosidase